MRVGLGGWDWDRVVGGGSVRVEEAQKRGPSVRLFRKDVWADGSPSGCVTKCETRSGEIRREA